jgi:hypothetical protein
MQGQGLSALDLRKEKSNSFTKGRQTEVCEVSPLSSFSYGSLQLMRVQEHGLAYFSVCVFLCCVLFYCPASDGGG